MSNSAEVQTPDTVADQVQRTRKASRTLARLSADQRNNILLQAADLLEARAEEILQANQQDWATMEAELARDKSITQRDGAFDQCSLIR